MLQDDALILRHCFSKSYNILLNNEYSNNQTTMFSKTFTISAFVIAFISLGLSLYLFDTKPKNAYIDIPKVYEEFSLKKELEAKLENTQNARQGVLDSLKLKLQVLQHHIKGEKNQVAKAEYDRVLQEYYGQEQRFQQDNQTQSMQYNEQILTQLNQYVADYGKKMGFDMVFGANSDGSIMYAKDMHNISNDVIAYINSRYQGAGE